MEVIGGSGQSLPSRYEPNTKCRGVKRYLIIFYVVDIIIIIFRHDIFNVL